MFWYYNNIDTKKCKIIFGGVILLFRTVYGPELSSVFFWIKEKGPFTKRKIKEVFGKNQKKRETSSISIDDAISFLSTIMFLKENNRGEIFCINREITPHNFKMMVLKQLREIQFKGNQNGNHMLDPFYLGLLEAIFIKKNKPFVRDIHQQANKLDLPCSCSSEKINSWKRVMEFLEVGKRGYGGFLVYYSPAMLEEIIKLWGTEGPLQDLLENHINNFFPWANQKGDISLPVQNIFLLLEQNEKLLLKPKQDLPNKCYLGERRIKWVKWRGEKSN